MGSLGDSGPGHHCLLRMVPYGFWRKLHRLFAPVYLMGVFHSVILTSQAFWWTPLGWGLAIAMLAGVFAALASLQGKTGSLQRYGGSITALRPCRAICWK
jgi:predicted ferric reductase